MLIGRSGNLFGFRTKHCFLHCNLQNIETYYLRQYRLYSCVNCFKPKHIGYYIMKFALVFQVLVF